MLKALVVRFEARGKHPLFSEMLHDYLDAMHIDDAGSVLDLGCGRPVWNLRRRSRMCSPEIGKADFWSSAIEA